jgi:MFS family permease
VLGGITLAVAAACLLFLRERPGTVSSPTAQNTGEITQDKKQEVSLKAIVLVYFIFGFAYNIYATYFVAFMVDQIQLPARTAGFIWSIFGWMCLISGLIWGFLSDRYGRRKALLWNNGIISLALLIPLLAWSPFLLGVSTFLFGLTFLGTVTIVAACVGDLVTEKKAILYGMVTLIHGIGQLIGTISGGYLKDLTGSFQMTLTSSFLGFLLCLGLILGNKKG